METNEAKKQVEDPRVLELMEAGMDAEEAIIALQMSTETNTTNPHKYISAQLIEMHIQTCVTYQIHNQLCYIGWLHRILVFWN